MAKLTIGSREVTVDDSFLSLSPEQQNATVEEITKSFPQDFSWSRAITGIPEEMRRTAGEHAQTIKNAMPDPENKSVIQSQLDSGKAILSTLGAIPNILGGAPYRSITGHTAANLANKMDQVVAPEKARTNNPDQMYEYFRPQVDESLMAAAPRAASPVGPRAVPAPRPTPAQHKQAAEAVWERPDIKSMPIPPEAIRNLSQQMQNHLLQKGWRDAPDNASGTLREVRGLEPKRPPEPSQFERLQAEMNWEKPPVRESVKNVYVDDLRAADRALGKIAGQTDIKGKSTVDAAAAMQARTQLKDFMDTLSPDLRTANKDYSIGSMAEALSGKAIKAARREQKKGTGNLEQLMRDEVDKLRTGGLSPEQKAAFERIVTGGNKLSARNILRTLGKGGVGGKLSAMLHGGAAYGTGGMSLPITAGGTLARKLGEGLTKRSINSLRNDLLESSPLAKSLQALPPKQASKVTKSLVSALLGGIPARQPALGMVPAYADQDKRKR
jgi:uncharacterized protein YoaH (UPF0181 family)